MGHGTLLGQIDTETTRAGALLVASLAAELGEIRLSCPLASPAVQKGVCTNVYLDYLGAFYTVIFASVLLYKIK